MASLTGNWFRCEPFCKEPFIAGARTAKTSGLPLAISSEETIIIGKSPLIQLYDYYLEGDEENHDYAVLEAGKAAGRLLKEVLINDKRTFATEKDYTRMFRWTGEEANWYSLVMSSSSEGQRNLSLWPWRDNRLQGYGSHLRAI